MALHPYRRSLHSNAGNCECGMAEESRVHPHAYAQASRSNLCVCAYPAAHPIHTDADSAQPNPVYPEPRQSGMRGIDAVREAVRQARGDEAAPQTPIRFAAPDEQTAGPRCGNNPNVRLTDGDRKAVAEFKAYLTRRRAGGPPEQNPFTTEEPK